MANKLIETPITDVIEDAQLGADVLDDIGNLLMPAGATLSLKAIERLIEREISQVTIVEKEVMTEEQHAILVVDIENNISERFRKTNSLPLMAEFKQALIDYRIKELDS